MLRTFFILLCLIGSNPVFADSEQLLLKNINLVSPEREAVIYDTNVLVEGDTIIEIGPYLTRVSPTAHIVEGSGLFLTPGLIDSHVHLYHASGLKRQYTDDFDSLYADYMQQMPRSYLYFGYTTLIELNADFRTNDYFEQQTLKPRLFHCGQGVVLPDGFMALEYPDGTIVDHFPNFLLDTYQSKSVSPTINPEDHTPEAIVAEVKDKGGICIKLYYEEANWWPGKRPDFALPSREIIQDVVAAGRKQGMPVILHATAAKGYEVGIEAGIDIFAHGLWDWAKKDGKFAVYPDAQSEKILEKVAKTPTAIQPTMRTLRNTASLYDQNALTHPDLHKVLPPEFINYLKTDAQVQRDTFFSLFASSVDAKTDDDVKAIQLAFNNSYEQLIGQFHAKGGRLLFGTDTAVGGFGWGNPPGLNGYWEMQGWRSAGVPLKTIFSAATIENAKAFGLDHQIGTIEVGKKADLLLMRLNPLEDLAAYNSIETVIIDGQHVERKNLSVLKN